MCVDSDKVRECLRDVYWIGGGPGGGKSTTARGLADRHGLHLYATDDVMSDHGGRLTAQEAPYLAEFIAMDMDERWLNRTPETMLDTFHWFRGEGFALIIEDLLRLPPGTRVVAEGFRLLPYLVEPLLTEPDQAVWLLPTPEFYDTALSARGSTWTIPAMTSDPERTRQNMSDRDRMFVDRMVAETDRLDLQSIRLTPDLTEDEVLDRVSWQFGLGD